MKRERDTKREILSWELRSGLRGRWIVGYDSSVRGYIFKYMNSSGDPRSHVSIWTCFNIYSYFEDLCDRGETELLAMGQSVDVFVCVCVLSFSMPVLQMTLVLIPIQKQKFDIFRLGFSPLSH